MIDLSQHDINELSNRVFDDTYFTSEIENTNLFLSLVKEEFLYTRAQMKVLVTDLNISREHMKNGLNLVGLV